MPSNNSALVGRSVAASRPYLGLAARHERSECHCPRRAGGRHSTGLRRSTRQSRRVHLSLSRVLDTSVFHVITHLQVLPVRQLKLVHQLSQTCVLSNCAIDYLTQSKKVRMLKCVEIRLTWTTW